jgi:hypothetical protein
VPLNRGGVDGADDGVRATKSARCG